MTPDGGGIVRFESPPNAADALPVPVARSVDDLEVRTETVPVEAAGSGRGSPSLYRIRFAAMITKLEGDFEIAD